MTIVIPPLFGVILVAVVCIAVTQSAASGSLTRNGGAGIRTRKTQVSDAAWLAGHRAALPIVKWTGVVAVISVIIALVVQWQVGGQSGVFLALGGMLIEATILLFAAKVAGNAASQS